MTELDRRLVEVSLESRPEGVVATVLINNARKLNVLNTAVMTEFVAAFEELASRDDLRAVILTGAGPKAFIGGADINEMGGMTGPDEARAFITRVHRCCEVIRDCPVPVLARIQGYTFGGGLEIAAACDVRIAAEDAIFGMPEVKLGIPSVVEAALLPQLIGWGRTRELLLLGENFTAKDALEWRFVEHIVPASNLDGAVEGWIAALMTSKPRAVRLQKQLIRDWEDLSLQGAIDRGIDAFAAAFETDEPSTAMAAFFAAQAERKRQA
jgi:enoyl-CoA hydratase/carnithine racemase